MAPWNPKLSNLRNILAGLYWREEDARRIVLEVGLNPIFIEFSSRPIITWQSILEYAGYHQQVDAIIAKAYEEFPQVQSLALAQQDQLHLAIETPSITDAGWHGPIAAEQLEKLMGAASTLRPISFLQRGLEVARAVGRVVLADRSTGSGFLIGNNLLITNNHVLASQSVAASAYVEFNYQKTVQGTDADVARYNLAPEVAFATSPEEEQGGDDWTVVYVRDNPNARWGALPLRQMAPRPQDEAIIIQHPGGGQKQIALSHNIITYVDDRRLQYLTDTLEGSSGAPVFNINWELVAVHHKGGWLREPNSKRAIFRNQGVHINAVIAGLAAQGLF